MKHKLIKIQDDVFNCTRTLYIKGRPVFRWVRQKLIVDKLNLINNALSYQLNSNLNRITARGTSKELQEVQIKLLSVLNKLCKNNNLTYWLDFGTLIGAARNGSFIPWDDDIDVSMLRTDFERILNLEKQLPSNYYFDAKDRSDIIGLKNKNLPKNIGLDIFCADMIKNDISLTDALNISKNIINIQSNTPHKTKIKTLKEVDIFLAQNKILKTNNLNEANSIMYGPGFCHHTHPSIILKKSNIFPLKTIKFEGCDYPCPNNIDVHLSLLYKDYLSADWSKLPHNQVSDLAVEELIQIKQFLNQ